MCVCCFFLWRELHLANQEESKARVIRSRRRGQLYQAHTPYLQHWTCRVDNPGLCLPTLTNDLWPALPGAAPMPYWHDPGWWEENIFFRRKYFAISHLRALNWGQFCPPTANSIPWGPFVSLPSWNLSAGELAEFFSSVILSREAPAQIPAVACSQASTRWCISLSLGLLSPLPIAAQMFLGPVVDRPVNHPLVPPLQAPEPTAAPSLAPAQTRWSLFHCRHQSQRPSAQIWSMMRLLTSWPHSTFRATRHRSVWFRSAQMLLILASICLDCSHCPWNATQRPSLPTPPLKVWKPLLKSQLCHLTDSWRGQSFWNFQG